MGNWKGKKISFEDWHTIYEKGAPVKWWEYQSTADILTIKTIFPDGQCAYGYGEIKGRSTELLYGKPEAKALFEVLLDWDNCYNNGEVRKDFLKSIDNN